MRFPTADAGSYAYTGSPTVTTVGTYTVVTFTASGTFTYLAGGLPSPVIVRQAVKHASAW